MLGSFQPSIGPRVSKGDHSKEVFIPILRHQARSHRPGHPEIQQGARHDRQQNSKEVFRVEDALDHNAVDAVLAVLLEVAFVCWGASEFPAEPE